MNVFMIAIIVLSLIMSAFALLFSGDDKPLAYNIFILSIFTIVYFMKKFINDYRHRTRV